MLAPAAIVDGAMRPVPIGAHFRHLFGIEKLQVGLVVYRRLLRVVHLLRVQLAQLVQGDPCKRRCVGAWVRG